MIHILHGFLGTPHDFEFLAGPGVIVHDLNKISDIEFTEEDILIGYSMGGRIALELAAAKDFKLKKLILINAHPGLATDEERKSRVIFENDVLKKLKLSRSEFLSWWNALPIFHEDRPIVPQEEIFKRASETFDKFRLSNQKNYLPELLKHREKVLWVIGNRDEKFMKLALEVLQPMDIDFVTVQGGHRLFQNQRELSSVLKEVL